MASPPDHPSGPESQAPQVMFNEKTPDATRNYRRTQSPPEVVAAGRAASHHGRRRVPLCGGVQLPIERPLPQVREPVLYAAEALALAPAGGAAAEEEPRAPSGALRLWHVWVAMAADRLSPGAGQWRHCTASSPPASARRARALRAIAPAWTQLRLGTKHRKVPHSPLKRLSLVERVRSVLTACACRPRAARARMPPGRHAHTRAPRAHLALEPLVRTCKSTCARAPPRAANPLPPYVSRACSNCCQAVLAHHDTSGESNRSLQPPG